MSGTTIVILTVVVIFGYIAGFMLLLSLFYKLLDTIQGGSAKTVLVLLIPFLLIGGVCVILDLIHTIMFIWFGYGVMTGIRNWWHRGASK